jgi:hydroxymethylpyrimidine/phosphomethylpyrimidine kinase
MSTNPNPMISSTNSQPPVILAFGALDPAGGGGLQADIETAASLGCHCAPVATALCTTGNPETSTTLPIESTILIEQARSVLEEMPVAAIKIGFMGSVANVEAVHSILRDYPHIPVVMHPALHLWNPESADQSALLDALVELLLPQITAIHLSIAEIREIAPEADTIDASAQAMINHGCEYVLLCGSGPEQRKQQNRLYRAQGLVKEYQWELAAPCSHNSASTLAASVAAYLAHNCHPMSAVEQGQNYTWQALAAARRIGSGSAIPHRFYWADQSTTVAERELPAERSTH